MDTAELLKKVKHLEIKSKGKSVQLFSGEYKSTFKGRGMSFSEVREYHIGDDVRAIDWNVTARTGNTHIKVYDEERELTVMLLIDISASESFGTRQSLKRDLIAEVCATIAFSAIQNNDKVGVVFFSDKIEKFIPPKKGKSHILLIIRELLNIEASSKKTNIAQALTYFMRINKKRATTFIISDFIDTGFEDELKMAANKHDLLALHILDNGELQMPNIGFLPIQNKETGETHWIDTSNKSNRKYFEENTKNALEVLSKKFKTSGVRNTTLYTHTDYVTALRKVFKK